MAHFLAFKTSSEEVGRSGHVFVRNAADQAWFEPVTDSNKGFKAQFLLIRAKDGMRETAKAKLTCPTPWSRVHYDQNQGAFNVSSKKLGESDTETFNQLKEWGLRLKKGLKKFPCEQIIKAEAESTEALKALLAKLKEYDPETDPEVAARREAAERKASIKAYQKRKRQELTRGGEGSSRASRTPKTKVPLTVSILEQFGIKVPAASDFAAVLKVYQAAADIAKELESQPEVAKLMALAEKKEARNLELEGDLQDREDKLSSCKELLIPQFQDENTILRAEIDSLANAKADLELWRSRMAEDLADAEKADEAEKRFSEAQFAKVVVVSRVRSLETEVQQLEAQKAQVERRLKEAEAFGFERCKSVFAVLAPGAHLDLLILENQVVGDKVVRTKEGCSLEEAEVLYELSDEEASK